MTLSIALVLVILLGALILFVTEKLRADVVALLTLCALGISGLVSPAEAIAGFSNPAVVTIWAMFILSAGLSATGVADIIGRQLLKLSGHGEAKVILLIMLVSGVLSGFMNNIGVAAMMLPVVMDIARRTGLSPARLLMPMAFASLLGGMTTLVGTSLNLVASGTLVATGLDGFALFAFTPIGVPALVIGSLFAALVGRHLLPKDVPDSLKQARREAGTELQFSHDLAGRSFRVRVEPQSPFDGCPLYETGLGPMLGIHVRAVQRGGARHAPVDGDFVLAAGDVLEVQGRREEFKEFLQWQALEVATGREIAELLARRLVLAKVTLARDSEIEGLTVEEADFHRRFKAHLLGIMHENHLLRSNLGSQRLKAGCTIQIEMAIRDFEQMEKNPAFSSVEVIGEENFGDAYSESETLLEMDIPKESGLAGRTLQQTGLHEALGLQILAIGRRPELLYFPPPDEVLRPGDKLLARGGAESLKRMRGLQSLVEISGPDAGQAGLTHSREELTEATLAPGSTLAGKSLRELNFRRRYGIQVLSIWRKGRAYRSYLRNFTLEFGDAFLLSGARENIAALSGDPDFLLLSRASLERTEETKSGQRAPLAASLMIAVAVVVMLDLLPVAIAALSGATLMILTRCLTIEAAHRAIEWKSVFLIACMLPMGVAMQESGAAALLAGGLVSGTAPLGTWGLLVGLYICTALGTTVVPAAAVVLIMANVAIDVAAESGLPPHMVVMTVAMAAAASFTSPISHPANILVMGPGGYRFAQYLKLGLLLALIVMLTVLPLIVWIYQPR